MDKTIVTAAITGAIHTPSMSPYLPLTGNQIIEEILAVHEAGGAIAHVHVRNEESGLPIADQDIFRRVGEEVKRHCDIIICFTTGGALGEPVENRVRVVSNLHPELASLNAGSLNFALFHVADRANQWRQSWEKGYLEATEDFIFPNTFRTMREFLTIFRANNTKPEFEIYDVGMVNNLAYLIKAGHADEPVHLQFVMGILGGIPATCENLISLLNTAQKALGRFTWSVCAAGRAQFPMCTQALLLGGHVRVGLEDNLYLDRGVMAKSNAEQVSKIIRIIRELGGEPATPDEARAILGLKGLNKVNY
ncbi:MAG: 3-keto-5-aminohexanoate cleavage protein [Thermodesulfobacteriota bacterium]